MALHATFDAAHMPLHKGRVFQNRGRVVPYKEREPHDLAPIFWSIATPACLAFWAAVAYAIHSAL